MAIYSYKCKKCGIITKILKKKLEKVIPCECGGDMDLLPPKPMDPTVLEVANKWTNVKHRKNQDKRIRERARDYFIENELGDTISKIGKENAKKLGWIKKGRQIKKDDVK